MGTELAYSENEPASRDVPVINSRDCLSKIKVAEKGHIQAMLDLARSHGLYEYKVGE